MAATQYQVLYRYINEATNTAITNSMDNDYEPVREFYVDPGHRIFSSDSMVQAEATDDQQEMISYGNSSENPKNNMLFAYDGTKKIKHKKWVEETTGYVVRDWKQLKRSSIGNQGDFSKEFTTINAATPEDGGLVICTINVKNKYFPSTITVVTDNTLADKGSGQNKYFSEDKINQLITESTLFALNTNGYQDHTSPSDTVSVWSSGPSYNKNYTTIYTGPVAIGANDMRTMSFSTGVSTYGQQSPNNLYKKVTVSSNQVLETQIPGHYEEQTDSPYLIMDTYKRIQLSPWFVNCTCGSLDSALTKAKALAEVIGINNIKIIKIVPFNQFIKIK